MYSFVSNFYTHVGSYSVIVENAYKTRKLKCCENDTEITKYN